MSTPKPDGESEFRGFRYARWGQAVVPDNGFIDPVPTVYNTAREIEIGELVMSHVDAEALIARLAAALAYERERAVVGGETGDKAVIA